ncbi:MAG: LptF/LptG family permease [Armatimonadota bacterium]|nr:LptF/LptG family permease [Armatimonadota bacterium]
MIKTLDRYLFRELAVPLLVGTVSVVLMFLANMMIAYAQDVFSRDIPLSSVLQYLLLKVPQTLNMTLPVGVTLAGSLAISRLARESELTAMRAAGISIRRVIVPFFLVGVVVSLLSFYLAEFVTPKTEARATETMRKIFASAEAINLRSNVLLKLNNGEYHASLGLVRKNNKGQIEIDDILVFQKPKRGEDWVVQAPKAIYDDGLLQLFDATVIKMSGIHTQFLYPKVWEISLRMNLDDFFGVKAPEAMSITELGRSLKEWKSQGQDVRAVEVVYHNKLAVPAACAVFALFAPVIAFYFSKGGAFIGVLISIIIVFLYYNIWILSSQVLAKGWIVPPLLGAWLPNILFFTAGVYALWRAD